MAVWINAEPGVLRSAAFNTMMIASVSTLLFNSNPLLRFDAYYIFADLVEITQSGVAGCKVVWYWLAQRYLFGMREAVNPITRAARASGLQSYAPASLVYRLHGGLFDRDCGWLVYFFIGVALVAWTLAQSFVWPLLRRLQFVLVSPAVGRRRPAGGGCDARRRSCGSVGSPVYLPLPHGTVAQGVLWVPDEARLTAATLGTVKRFLVEKPELWSRPERLLSSWKILYPQRAPSRRRPAGRAALSLQSAESLAPATITFNRKQWNS